MVKRSELREKLEELLGPNKEHIYFQPPESVKLKYPCFVYELARGDHFYSNNMTYHFTRAYEVTYISKNPDDGMVEKMVNSFSMISHNRHFVTDNLNHEVFVLYW